MRAVSRVFRSGRTTVNALSEVSFSVPRGGFVAVTGRSGSGKTTLLNLIGGLDRPDSGSVSVLGEPLAEMRERALTAFRRRAIGYVFQDPLLLPGLTAFENVIAGRIAGSSWKRLASEARDLLGAVGLAQRLDFPPDSLSGGERQRVSLARALLGHPALLLADEPTGNLDSRTTWELLELLGELQAAFGLTVIVATHDLEVAASAPKRMALADGRLVGVNGASPS